MKNFFSIPTSNVYVTSTSVSPVTDVTVPIPTTAEEDDDYISPPVAPDHSTAAISPSAGLAEYCNVSKDYVNFIFPEVYMAHVDIIEPSVDNIDTSNSERSSLIPSAMMTSTTTDDNSVFTSSEQDVLFSHELLQNHKAIEKEFHVDWGSNIMIINSIDAFTELMKCDEQIHPIDGVPIIGIKGYGTVIFRLGNRLVPVCDVAFIPNNPQSTFTSSHLQRMNSSHPGIHALHSSIKIIDRNDITAKFTPTKRNGLDYINISLIVPKDNPSYAVVPSASMARAKPLSPHLIHQKCRRYLVEGGMWGNRYLPPDGSLNTYV